MIFIFISSLLIRIFSIFWISASLSGDAKVYDSLAKSIIGWGGLSVQMLKNFPLKDHPVYPLFISANYYLFGESLTPVWIMQAILGSFLCILIYLITKEIFDRRIALLAGLATALYPVFIKLSIMMLSEGLFVFIFTFSFFLAVRYLKTLKLHYLIASSVMLGITALTRSVVILFPFLLSSYIFYRDRNRLAFRKNFTHQGLFILVFIGTVSLWSIRNYHVTGGQIVPVTEAPDRGLYNSFCPYKGKIFGIRPDNDPVMVEARSIQSLGERRKFFVSKTTEFIKNNPVKVIKLEFLKFLYLWSPFDWEILGNGYARYNFGFVFLLPFFIYGIFNIIYSKKAEYFILLLPIIYFQVIHLIYFALPRFRIGFEPVLIIISSLGILRLFDKSKNKKIFVTSTFLFLLTNIVFFLYSSQVKGFFRDACRLAGIW